jgi:hypothetical protein
MCYKAVLTGSKTSDSNITSHETKEFTEEDDCEDDADCFTQSIKPNDFLLINSETKKTMKYSAGLIQELGPDGYSTRFLMKRLTCWTLFSPEIEDNAVIDPADNVLKLPHLVVSGSNCRIVTMIFGKNLSGYHVK